jgi:post-segregation antitoxin (ccd killing protein)
LSYVCFRRLKRARVKVNLTLDTDVAKAARTLGLNEFDIAVLADR